MKPKMLAPRRKEQFSKAWSQLCEYNGVHYHVSIRRGLRIRNKVFGNVAYYYHCAVREAAAPHRVLLDKLSWPDISVTRALEWASETALTDLLSRDRRFRRTLDTEVCFI